MNKIFLSVASMIVTHFLQKAYRKITEKTTTDKDEIYRLMKKSEYDARRAAARPITAKLDSIYTPRDGAKIMDAIGSVQQMLDDIRPSNDQCDAMPMGSIGRF